MRENKNYVKILRLKGKSGIKCWGLHRSLRLGILKRKKTGFRRG